MSNIHNFKVKYLKYNVNYLLSLSEISRMLHRLPHSTVNVKEKEVSLSIKDREIENG